MGDNGSADHEFSLGSFTAINVEAGDGRDRIRIDTANGGFTNAKPTRIHGQGGDDTLIGGDGNETFVGGRGNDVVDGNGGADIASLGGGNDTFDWDPGDGSDVVRGGGGTDTLVFTGSNDDEVIGVSADGGRVAVTRDVGNVVMDLDAVEAIRLRTLLGNEQVTIGDLTGTDLASVDVDLAAVRGGTTPDNQKDFVTVTGTAGKRHDRRDGDRRRGHASMASRPPCASPTPTPTATGSTSTPSAAMTTSRSAPASTAWSSSPSSRSGVARRLASFAALAQPGKSPPDGRNLAACCQMTAPRA